MGKENKRKFHYDSITEEVKEAISSAEEEISREQFSREIKKNVRQLLDSVDNEFEQPVFFFEDNGIIYGLSDNIFLNNRINTIH